jgi:hypothetical protein
LIDDLGEEEDEFDLELMEGRHERHFEKEISEL